MNRIISDKDDGGDLVRPHMRGYRGGRRRVMESSRLAELDRQLGMIAPTLDSHCGTPFDWWGDEKGRSSRLKLGQPRPH